MNELDFRYPELAPTEGDLGRCSNFGRVVFMLCISNKAFVCRKGHFVDNFYQMNDETLPAGAHNYF